MVRLLVVIADVEINSYYSKSSWLKSPDAAAKLIAGYVRFWHLADDPTAPAFVRFWSNSGQRWILARDGLSANDPKRTSATLTRRIFFEADFDEAA
jgi:hypothetical protein